MADHYSVEVIQGYGMTEASPVTHITLLGRDKPGTVGPPVADTRQKVVDLGHPTMAQRERPEKEGVTFRSPPCHTCCFEFYRINGSLILSQE